jgi:hypothetical protein
MRADRLQNWPPPADEYFSLNRRERPLLVEGSGGFFEVEIGQAASSRPPHDRNVVSA